MIWYFIVPLTLALLTGLAGYMFFVSLKPTGPKFEHGRFTGLEHRLLEEFFKLYEPQLAKKLKQQVHYFTSKGKYLVIRNAEGLTVELYENESNLLSEHLTFPLNREVVIGRMKFSLNAKDYRMDIKAYNGRIWGWIITPAPELIYKKEKLFICSKEILLHPEDIKQVKRNSVYEGVIRADGFLAALLGSPSLTGVKAPGQIERLQLQLKRTRTVLPESFIDLLKFADGMTFSDFRILSSRALIREMTEAGLFLPMVEFREEFLGVRTGEGMVRLYMLSKRNGQLSRLESGFEETLLSRLETFSIP